MLDGPGILEIPFVKGEARATELGLLRFADGRVRLGPDKLDRVRPLVNSCSDTFLGQGASQTVTHTDLLSLHKVLGQLFEYLMVLLMLQ